MKTITTWALAALTCIGLSLSLPAQAASDPAALLDKALSVLSVDAESSFADLFASLKGESVEMSVDGVVVTMDGESIEVTRDGNFVFGQTVYARSSGAYTGSVFTHGGDDGISAESLIIIDEMGIIVIYFGDQVIILIK